MNCNHEWEFKQASALNSIVILRCKHCRMVKSTPESRANAGNVVKDNGGRHENPIRLEGNR